MSSFGRGGSGSMGRGGSSSDMSPPQADANPFSRVKYDMPAGPASTRAAQSGPVVASARSGMRDMRLANTADAPAQRQAFAMPVAGDVVIDKRGIDLPVGEKGASFSIKPNSLSGASAKFIASF